MRYELRCYGAPYSYGEFAGEYPTIKAARAGAHRLRLTGLQRARIIDLEPDPILDGMFRVEETIYPIGTPRRDMR